MGTSFFSGMWRWSATPTRAQVKEGVETSWPVLEWALPLPLLCINVKCSCSICYWLYTRSLHTLHLPRLLHLGKRSNGRIIWYRTRKLKNKINRSEYCKIVNMFFVWRELLQERELNNYVEIAVALLWCFVGVESSTKRKCGNTLCRRNLSGERDTIIFRKEGSGTEVQKIRVWRKEWLVMKEGFVRRGTVGI
jgi:hypothetical protein